MEELILFAEFVDCQYEMYLPYLIRAGGGAMF